MRTCVARQWKGKRGSTSYSSWAKPELDKLYGKKIFTKLDVKNGFHQILIHADDTKYFSFTTPSGQYEFLKLPFGFSEGPEFQKCILIIFKDLVRSNKILIYMDNLLIATENMQENL